MTNEIDKEKEKRIKLNKYAASWRAKNRERWLEISKACYAKHYLVKREDSEYMFNKAYTKEKIDIVLSYIPLYFREHKDEIFAEYKRVWCLIRSKHRVDYIQLLYAVMLHLTRKNGWNIPMKGYTTTFKSPMRKLMYDIKTILHIANLEHLEDKGTYKFYNTLCLEYEDYGIVREDYYAKIREKAQQNELKE